MQARVAGGSSGGGGFRRLVACRWFTTGRRVDNQKSKQLTHIRAAGDATPGEEEAYDAREEGRLVAAKQENKQRQRAQRSYLMACDKYTPEDSTSRQRSRRRRKQEEASQNQVHADAERDEWRRGSR